MTTNGVAQGVLMKARLAGDAAAYRTLLVDLTPHLCAYFMNRLGPIEQSATQAEDLVQTALMTIHHRRHTYAPQRALIPWICAIARYRLLNHLRETRGSLASVSVDDACTAQSTTVCTGAGAPVQRTESRNDENRDEYHFDSHQYAALRTP